MAPLSTEVPAVTRLPVETTRLDNDVDDLTHQKNTATRKTGLNLLTFISIPFVVLTQSLRLSCA
jgi:hypothetical protein